jgi:hypothetical protein
MPRPFYLPLVTYGVEEAFSEADRLKKSATYRWSNDGRKIVPLKGFR